MMRTIKIALFTLSFLFCLQARADTASDELSHLLLNIHSMQANFTQTVQDKSAQSTTQSSGKMSLVRPGKFRWEVTKPNKELIIASGTHLWIYDPYLQQATLQTLRGGTGKAPALLLSDENLELENNYNVRSVPALMAIAGLEIFELTPKDPDDPLQNIKLTFLQKQIHEMQLQDRLGHTTRISFNKVESGKPVADSLFKFTPPENIDVIDETKDPK
jgi:outer membrane lipoprotein carrier protein